MGSWVAMGRLMDVAGHGENGKTMKKTVKAKKLALVEATLREKLLCDGLDPLDQFPDDRLCAWGLWDAFVTTFNGP